MDPSLRVPVDNWNSYAQSHWKMKSSSASTNIIDMSRNVTRKVKIARRRAVVAISQ